MSSSSTLNSARPQAALDAAPARVQEALADLSVPTSQWGTVATFVLSDVVGLQSVFGTLYLATSWAYPSAAPLVYQAIPLVLPLLIGAFLLVGLYRRRFAHPALEMQRMGTVVGLVGGTAALSVMLATGEAGHALLILAGTALAVVVMPVCRTLSRILFARAAWWGLPAVVVSAGESGTPVIDTLQRWPEIGIRPVALLSDHFADAGPEGPVQGGYDLAPYLAQRFQIPYAVVAMPSLTHAGRAKLLSQYAKFFEHVFVVGDPGESAALWTTGRSGDGLFGYGVQHAALRPVARAVKRLVDIVGAGLALCLLAPVFAVVALLIRMDAPGAVFYRQERMGQEGRIFTVLKFRTMYTNAEEKLADILASDPDRRREYEQYHKLQDDPRVTRMGQFLRRYSLDEMPQLLNVLKGDMSLVGPRAYMPGELGQMNGLAQAVLQTPPGITGLWQVSGRNHVSFADRVNLDIHYIQNWSPWLDLYLLVRTLPVVFSGDGAA